MTGSEPPLRFPFQSEAVETFRLADPRHSDWPVVYTIEGEQEVYVGETANAAARMQQHLGTDKRDRLRSVRVILDETFNKSVCLDLESYLIQRLQGDGRYAVLNRVRGSGVSDYYERDRYRERFADIFERLRMQGLFSRSLVEIENSELFKYSPYKELNEDQRVAVVHILEWLFADLTDERSGPIVVQGDPGTGKTIVAIFLLKLLADIRDSGGIEEIGEDSLFAELFVPEHAEALRGFRAALVIPQQSLRRTLKKVFARVQGLHPGMVLSQWEVGESSELYDLLVVDETHRLNQRANQSSGVKNRQFRSVNERLFGRDDEAFTQLDWIRRQSRHQVFLLDAAQRVRPADLPIEALESLARAAGEDDRLFPLRSQMRVLAGDDYVGYVRSLLRGAEPAPRAFGDYDFRMFDDFARMREAIRRRDEEAGFSRLVAGYAWEWRSKGDPAGWDIELDGVRLPWNRTDIDWIASPGSIDEVGSIHTVQGYDLNYAGVIIGPDLRYDEVTGRMVFDRASYFDKKGKENNPRLGKAYTDDDLLEFVAQIYGVLLTRGIRGTYLYVCDPALRERLRRFVPMA